MYCWILFAKILLRIFSSTYISDISMKFSFLELSLVLVSGWSWPHRMSLEVLLPKQFFERVLMGQPLYCSAANAGMWRERGYGDGFIPYAWLSSIALLPWLPGFPPQAFPTTISSLTSPRSVSAVNSSPRLGIAPQSLNSSSQPLYLLGDLRPCLGCVWLQQGLSDSHSTSATTDQLFHSQP